MQIPSERLRRRASENREGKSGYTDVWDSGETLYRSGGWHRDIGTWYVCSGGMRNTLENHQGRSGYDSMT